MTGFSNSERRGLERIQTVAPGSHPDADLLAAFSEHSLTAREQEQVLAHLAICATCRDVVALAGSQLVEPVPEQLRKRGLWEVPLFHWGAAVATAIIVVFAIALGLRDYRVAAPKTAATETFNETLPPAQAVAPPPATADRAPGELKTKEEKGLAEGGPPSQLAQNASPPDTTTRAKHLQEQFRYERPADEAQNEPQSLDATAKKDAGAAADAIRGRRAEPLVLPKSADEANQRDQNAATFNSEAKVATKQAPAAPPSSGPVDQQATISGANVAGETQTPVGTQANHVSASQSGDLFKKKIAMVQPWRIVDGRFQHAEGAGVWGDVLPGHKIFSYAVAGNRVFAGGANGQMYASPDNGAHWNAISVHDGDTHVNGNITQLQFSDAQNGMLSTSAAETWTTSDGGQTWHKQ